MSIRITKDGRTIRDKKDYAELRSSLYRDQGGRCIECGGWTNLDAPIEMDGSFHVSHRGSRGLGSSLRDDVVGPRKGQIEGGKCGGCHRKAHKQGCSGKPAFSTGHHN